ncbi:MAG: sigma-70 family RNA polymerase sigma factor [Phycisphaerales bacterium]|nr:sigma-70 family RNA polymerase sigma factor [Phycisphaerales bacterium]
MDAPTDQKLLQEYLDGKAGSFELLVRRHTRELYQFVLRFTGDSVAAEDVVQETFLQVYSSARTYDPHRRFKPWLFTIAANKARDALRRRNRRHEVPFDANIGDENETGRRFVDLLSAEDTTPDEALLADEKRQVVRGVVESMPDNLSEVLILAYYHRFPYKEIGEIVGIPLGTVKSRLHAAVVCFGERYREAVSGVDQNRE